MYFTKSFLRKKISKILVEFGLGLVEIEKIDLTEVMRYSRSESINFSVSNSDRQRTIKP